MKDQLTVSSNQFKMDVYKIDVEKNNNIINLEISNIISWELMKIKGTKQEIKGLIDFLSGIISEWIVVLSKNSLKNQ